MCCSTTPKTKAASPAVNEVNKILKQAGSGAGGGTTISLKFEGRPEHVPQLTFIIEPRVAGDDYLASATDYHANCGMNPQQIQSIDHLVTLLAADAAPLKRIRVVGHASGEDLLIPMFGKTDVRADRHTFKSHLNAFAMSDERGLLNLFGLMGGQYLHEWSMTDVLTVLRKTSSTADLLKPFGLRDKGIPAGEDLKRFIFYCCDYAFINLNHYKKNNNPLSANEKAGMLKAYAALIGIKAKAIKGTTIDSHTITDSELTALSNHLKQLTDSDLSLDKKDVRTFNMPADSLNPFLLAGRAADAIVANFRLQLEKVRKRFSSDSYIDIRGCRAGNDRDYLIAIQDFFASSESSKPGVTAPLWYQAFAGTNSYAHPSDTSAIHDLLHKGTMAPAIRKGFAEWATMCHVDPEHTQIWSEAVDGSAVSFVLLDWRKKLPQLPVAAPGLTTYLNMKFIDFINKSENFFNIDKTSMPKPNVLTDIDTYITGKLKNYEKDLLAPVDSATAQTKLNNILAALKVINTEIGNPVNPFPSPGVSFNDLTDLQSKLVKFISDNQLKEIKPFIAAVKSRIADTADPGLNYYMLFGGMPVFVFSDHETINNHVVKVYNNMLVVLDSFADAAYRTWVQLSWEEPLPSGNRFGTLHPGDFTSRRSMMMVKEPTGGNTPAAVCPHSNYYDKMTSV